MKRSSKPKTLKPFDIFMYIFFALLILGIAFVVLRITVFPDEVTKSAVKSILKAIGIN
jgi:hypothetical protein